MTYKKYKKKYGGEKISVRFVITQQIQSGLNLTRPTHYAFGGISMAQPESCRHNLCISY